MDKIRQDAEQLGNLYYQYKKKETYHQALLDTISHGETEPKRFDVCEKISKSLEELGTKITETQNQIRKYYIDTYLDIQKKDDEGNPVFKYCVVIEGIKCNSASGFSKKESQQLASEETLEYVVLLDDLLVV